jgi:hypothetical protein
MLFDFERADLSALSTHTCSSANNGDAPGSDVARTVKPLEEQTIVHQLEASPEKFGVPTVSARNRSCEPLGLLPTLTNKGNHYVS